MSSTKQIVYSNRELVVLALSLVGGATKRVHTEDIALKCHELFPTSFSWTKYPHLPDKDIVRVALTDARKTSHGAMVDGRAGRTRGHGKEDRTPTSDGWILTESGLEFLNKHEAKLSNFVDAGEQKQHRQVVQKQAKRIRNHKLFTAFRESPEEFVAPIGQIADLLRCRVDAENEVWAKRFESLRLVAAGLDDLELTKFVEQLESSYQDQR